MKPDNGASIDAKAVYWRDHAETVDPNSGWSPKIVGRTHKLVVDFERIRWRRTFNSPAGCFSSL